MASVAVALLATPAFAQGAAAPDRTTSFGVDLFAGGHYFAEGTNLGVTAAPEASSGARGNALLGLRASLGLNPWAAAEVEFLGMVTTDRTYGRRASILGYRLNALAFLRHGNLRPFVLVGGGVIEVVATRADGPAGLVRDRDGEYHVGAGVEYRFLDHLAARADARVVQMPGKQDWSLASDFEATLGVVVPFGAGPRTMPRAEGTPAGTTPGPSSPDKQPPSPQPTKASSPAPAAPAAPAPEVPAPSAAVEVAPATASVPPAPIPVTPTVVPAPVAPAVAPAPVPKSEAPSAPPAARPSRPPTPVTPPASSRVPSVKELLGRAREIRFDGSGSKLSLVSLPLIGQLAEALDKERSMQLEIVCHTGGSGDKAGELALSKRRAEAVKKALVQREVESSRLKAIGRGSEEPLAPNVTNSGRRLNDRVELRPPGPEVKQSL